MSRSSRFQVVAYAAILALGTACAEPLPPVAAVPDAAAETVVSDTADAAAAAVDAAADVPESLDVAGDIAAETSAADVAPDAVVDAGADAGLDATLDADGSALDATALDGSLDAVDAPDAVSVVSCKPGVQKCEGAKLATCGSKGDGYILSNCFPGLTCIGDSCKTVSNNLIVLFDTSGSMTAKVKKKDGADLCPTNNYNTWPVCEYDPAQWPMGCTRMGMSKYVFKQALAKIDESATRMALFRFPQKFMFGGGIKSCNNGYYQSLTVIEKDAGEQAVVAPSSGGWFWDGINQVVSVHFPATASAPIKLDIGKWMNGTEDGTGSDPELRPNGGTPIGKSLFYIGEYLRHRVVIDGRVCTTDASCGNVNYLCKDGKCTDPSRSCRDTVVVVFTDGGEGDQNTFFSPRVQAKRLSMGLACNIDADCVGGAVCQSFKACAKAPPGSSGGGGPCSADADCTGTAGSGPCKSLKQCMPKESVTGYFCTQTNLPCLPPTTDPSTGKPVPAPGDPAYCNPSAPNNFGSCVKDPRMSITAAANNPVDNVLRSPNGSAFSVKVHIVDIGSLNINELANSMALAISGGGRLLGADAGDPEAFLSALDAAFDFKNKKVCGTTL